MKEIAAAEDLTIRSRRERWHIGLVLEIKGGADTAVLGIENKIDAGEQDEQVSRYQERIGDHFLTLTAAIVFLTPTGRDPRTANPNATVPVISLGYEAIRQVLLRVADQAQEKAEQTAWVLRSFAAHIEEEILGVNNARELVKSLWSEYPQAMRLAVKYRPRLQDVWKKLCDEIERDFPDDLYIRYSPESKVNLRWVKVTPRRWWDRGLTLTCMVQGDDERVKVRLLVPVGNPGTNLQLLQEWAEEVNDDGDTEFEVNPEFPSWTGDWGQVFVDFPEDGEVISEVWDRKAVEAAAHRVGSWIEMLRPTVEPFLRDDRAGILDEGSVQPGG